MKGFINLIKPKDMSSAYAVGAVKWKLKVPCGHMGTLDPLASGVLPVGVGQASRLFDYLLDKQKTYIAEFKFGSMTDTLDILGVETNRTSVIPDIKEIEKNLSKFIGKIEQIPPKYSAKCVDGKKGYELARKGIDFTLQPKIVEVLDFKCLGQTEEDTYKFKIDCKGGTYIRSLARDLSLSCNSLAVMSSLIRTKSGIFEIENGVSVQDFKNSEDAEKYLIPPEDAINFEKIVLNSRQAERLLNGLYDDYSYKDGLYKIYNEQEFWGVGEVKNEKIKMRCYVR